MAWPAGELEIWRQFYSLHGFPSDRREAGIAIAGAATCQSWGAKVKPEELLPRFGPQKKQTREEFIAVLEGLPGLMEIVPNGE